MSVGGAGVVCLVLVCLDVFVFLVCLFVYLFIDLFVCLFVFSVCRWGGCRLFSPCLSGFFFVFSFFFFVFSFFCLYVIGWDHQPMKEGGQPE